MTEPDSLSPRDLEQLADLGIATGEIQRQLALFRQPPPPANLVRPCLVGDGIVRITRTQQDGYVTRWRALARHSPFAKFVPASGAATRMFKDLTAPPAAAEPDETAGVARLLESLNRFAFFESLEQVLEGLGLSISDFVEPTDTQPLVAGLLESHGLGYGIAPKGLILFHGYPGGSRSALEEQLWEGSGYLAPDQGTGRYHFTVAAAHEKDFRELISRLRSTLESHLGIGLDVSFSTQSPATDTVAVDADGRLLRSNDGQIVLRPAGHGALLENLQNVGADVVFIKNIDNVSHQRLHPVSVHWKRVLAGYFGEIQERIFETLSAIDRQPDSREPVDRGLELIRDSLAVEVPAQVLDADDPTRRQFTVDRLDRPLRVCGMVKNEGEPGGGPFWLSAGASKATGQIVEAAQVDHASPQQAEIWGSSTHFNPVDLVCGLRDRHDRPYRLQDFVDPATSFVAEKSHAGRPIRALERPGLWNGSMARWNTAFVEVPLETFTPVKTVFDLLRPEHQP